MKIAEEFEQRALTEPDIDFEIRDGVAWITLNRPEKFNAVDLQATKELLDVANRDFVVAQEPNSVWFEGDGCVCMDEMRVDFITSRLKVKRTVMLDDGRSRECKYSMRLYGMHELGRLLHSVGFRIREASGEPSIPGVFFGAHAPRILMLAQRPE